MTQEQPTFAREHMGYRYAPRGKGVAFRVDQLKWRGGDLWGLVEVTTERSDLPKFLHRHNYNLTGGNGKRDCARYLATRTSTSKADEDEQYGLWLALVEGGFNLVSDAESQGPALEWMGDREPPAGSPFIVSRLVEKGGINYLFGPGAQGKSWVAMALRVCVQLGIPFGGLEVRQAETLAVEYEDAEAYNWRLRAVLRGIGLPFQGFRVWAARDTLEHHARQLSRIMLEEQIGFYTVDSAGHAAGSPGEHGTWDSVALGLGKSAKLFLPAATPLIVDHTSGEGARENLAHKMMGGYRKYLDARQVWQCRKEQEQENAWMTVGLYQTKVNNFVTFKPVGIRMEFESDAWGRAIKVTFTPADLRDSAEHLGRLSPWDRIAQHLRERESLTTTELHKLLPDLRPDTVDRTLYRARDKGQLLTERSDGKGARGGVQRWFLGQSDNDTPKENSVSQTLDGLTLTDESDKDGLTVRPSMNGIGQHQAPAGAEPHGADPVSDDQNEFVPF